MEALLRHWRDQPVIEVSLPEIRTDADFQARASDLAPVRDRARLGEASAKQIVRMRAYLEAFTPTDLEPLLVADLGDALYLIDGHHRLEAYRLAKRASVPVRILVVARDTAVMASKLVNCGGEQLPMHPDQYRDAAWQYLAHVTRRGTLPLPSGVTCRSVAATFGGISADTVWRMNRMLASIDLSQFSPQACDPATGWPRWRYVRGNAWRDCFKHVSLEERMLVQATRLAKRIGDLRDKAGSDVFRMAIDLLIADSTDGTDDHRDQLSQLCAIDQDPPPDY